MARKNAKKIKEIEKVIKILKNEVKRFKKPVVKNVSYDKDPFLVLISCILSLRTKDNVTEKASERLFRIARTPQKMLKLNVKKIEREIYPVGFYKTKARRIKEISKTIVKKYKGKVPDKIEELLKLKGVGRKTANIVLEFGYNKAALPIDTHCHRIPNRIGWIKTKTPDETEKRLRKLLPKRLWKDFNNTFVVFGQNICLPVSPLCSKCPINKYCKRINVKRSR
ncbi:MAG: endonuclease III [Candidatus Woesearchaeota archaeon]|nr:endonuclease III [Candidatus Woesearchaeota archaeon]